MLKFTINQLSKAYCVYTLTDENDQIIFIGEDRFSLVLTLPDIIKNPHLDKDKPIVFNIIKICSRRTEARRTIEEWIRHNNRPIHNPKQRSGSRIMIRCNELNVIYGSQLEAATSLGICRSWLSKHLRNMPGNKSYKDLTFSRVAEPQANDHPVEYSPPGITPSPQFQAPPPALPPALPQSYFVPPQFIPAPPLPVPSYSLPIPQPFPPAESQSAPLYNSWTLPPQNSSEWEDEWDE